MHSRLEIPRSRRRTTQRSRAGRKRERHGFSLMELLLVLAIMAIIAAMILPQLFGVQGRQSLRNAADQLNGAMVDARQQAMVSGQTMYMLFQFDSGMYAVVPEPIDQETTAQFEQVTSALSQAANLSRLTGNEDTTSRIDLPGVDRLPAGVQILTGQAGEAQAENAATVQADISGLPYVAFAPDGTTDDAILQLVSEEQDQITVQLRGLTGAIRIGELVGPNQVGVGAVQ